MQLVRCIYNKGKVLERMGAPLFKVGNWYDFISPAMYRDIGRGWVTNERRSGPSPEWPVKWNQFESRWELDDTSIDCYFQELIDYRNSLIDEICG